MDLDVVIVTHESGDHIERAMGDLLSAANVVVVDNASTDTSVQRAREAGVLTVANEINAGFGAAANQGAALGSHGAILFLNPDATIRAHDLDVLLRELDHDRSVAIISPRVLYEDGTEQQVLWSFPSSRSSWQEAFGIHRFVRRPPRSGFVTGTCFMIRREVFEALGGFDSRYWLYGEEADLCHRAVDRGWRVVVSPDALARHVGGASGHGARDLVAEHFARGTERFIADRKGLGGLVSYRLANIVGAAVRSLGPGPAARRIAARKRFGRYVRALTAHPTTVPIDSPASAEGESIVLCSLEAWDDIWRRNQFLVRELLRADPHLRVLFIEPPFDWLHEARTRRKRRRAGLRPAVPDGRVLAFQPVKIAPRLLGPFTDRALRWQVERAVALVQPRSPTLWVNDPSYASLVGVARPSVYDITDDLTRMDAPPHIRRRVEDLERNLLAKAGAVVVCSEDLARTRRARRPDLHFVPNAVDRDHFTLKQPRPADLPPSPVAVYLGTLHDDRLDVALVIDLAKAVPALQIALVGPDALRRESRARLERLRNVNLLGARPYETVPGYLQHADVVIVPHVLTPFTESLDPIKAYECLAIRRPTVATPVAGFRELAGQLDVVARDQFVERVWDIVANPRAREPSDTPSWSERACRFRAAIDAARTPAR